MSKYLLRCHDFYFNRISDLKALAVKLYAQLNHEDFAQHPAVKLLKTVQVADQDIIPQDPDQPQYRLKGELKKYRRHKQGLRRYRLFFCFSSQPPIIVYLYLNDESHLRKEGSKNDPYEEFKRQIYQGHFSHNPGDPAMQAWLKNYRT